MRQKYSFLIVVLYLIIAIFFIGKIIAQGQTTTASNECKCLEKQHFFNSICTSEETRNCFVDLNPGSSFKPVCGCDKKTYANECVASNYGIKSFTEGNCNASSEIKCLFHSDCPSGTCPNSTKYFENLCEFGTCVKSAVQNDICNSIQSSSSSGVVECNQDEDCVKGACSNGKTYLAYSCLNNQCNQINYFVDPCLDLSSSSSGTTQIKLNKNFNGIWKARLAKPSKSSTSSSTSGSIECILCTQVFPICPENEIVKPQTCNECAHCESAEGEPVVSQPIGLFHLDEGFKGSRILTLNLCIKNGLLSGSVNQTGVTENAQIISQEIISKKEVRITATDFNGITSTITLKLVGGRTLLGTFSDGHTFKARKIANTRKCLESSGDISNCSSKGSCRGKRGKELSCPKGTECSGLPAYGCFPTGCPVPICCSYNTRIKTAGIEKNISDIKEKDLVISDENKPVNVIKTSKVEVKNHNVLKITLNDATILELSPGHPTSDGRTVKDLMVGDKIDNRMVIETRLIPYKYKYTYDILPDSKSGNYYANGVLIGSTLR